MQGFRQTSLRFLKICEESNPQRFQATWQAVLLHMQGFELVNPYPVVGPYVHRVSDPPMSVALATLARTKLNSIAETSVAARTRFAQTGRARELMSPLESPELRMAGDGV